MAETLLRRSTVGVLYLFSAKTFLRHGTMGALYLFLAETLLWRGAIGVPCLFLAKTFVTDRLGSSTIDINHCNQLLQSTIAINYCNQLLQSTIAINYCNQPLQSTIDCINYYFCFRYYTYCRPWGCGHHNLYIYINICTAAACVW